MFDDYCLMNFIIRRLINCKVIIDDWNMMMSLFYIIILHIKICMGGDGTLIIFKIIKKNIFVFFN